MPDVEANYNEADCCGEELDGFYSEAEEDPFGFNNQDEDELPKIGSKGTEQPVEPAAKKARLDGTLQRKGSDPVCGADEISEPMCKRHKGETDDLVQFGGSSSSGTHTGVNGVAGCVVPLAGDVVVTAVESAARTNDDPWAVLQERKRRKIDKVQSPVVESKFARLARLAASEG